MFWIISLIGCLGCLGLNRYSLVEKAYSVLFHVFGLSLRDVSERYYCF